MDGGQGDRFDRGAARDGAGMMRCWTTGLLTLLLAVSVIGWICYIPSSVLNPLRAVPSHAQLVYQCDAFDRAALRNMTFSKDWKNADRFFQSLEKRPLVLAVAPLGGRERRDTWIAVSAVGPRSVLWSWRLKFFPPDGMKPIRSYGAWPVWEYTDSSLPVWARVRFSVAEGLLICSVSGDSHDVEYLLDTLDGRRPSAERKGI